MTWRPMRAADLAAVSRAAAAIHPGYPEADAVFAERLELCPEGCRVLDDGGALAGYALTHPWRYGRPPKLDTLLGAIPADADTWYLHDVALLPGARGRGASAAIVGLVADRARARGLGNLSLVAVNCSRPVWEARGFAVAADAAPDLSSYGGVAWFMSRPLRDTI